MFTKDPWFISCASFPSHDEGTHVLSPGIASMQITSAEKCLAMLSLVLYQDEGVTNNVHGSPKPQVRRHRRVEDMLRAGPEATG